MSTRITVVGHRSKIVYGFDIGDVLVGQVNVGALASVDHGKGHPGLRNARTARPGSEASWATARVMKVLKRFTR